MLLSPIAVCEVVWAEIVFWSKFPAVRKIIMKLDYRLCVRCYYIVTVIAPSPPLPILPFWKFKIGKHVCQMYTLQLFMVVKPHNPGFVLFR